MIYRPNLAYIHHVAYGGYADAVAPGVLALLEPHHGGTILELGCGSGALTRHLIEAGHDVIATDASEHMLDLARAEIPHGDFRVLTLPHDPIPEADAIVSVGHAFSYLASGEDIEAGLRSCVSALRPGGLLAVDLLDLEYGEARSEPDTHAEVQDDWAIFLEKHLQAPDRYVRNTSTFVLIRDGTWLRDDETHTNTLIDVRTLATSIDGDGLTADVADSFGSEEPEKGFLVLIVHRSP